MTKKQKRILYRILITLALMIILHFVPATGVGKLALYLIPYLVIGHELLGKAFYGIRHGQVFDENFLMAVATIGAMVIGFTGGGDYVEAVAVMLLFQIGELFESYAVGKSRKNIAALMDIRPDYANLEVDGDLQQVDPGDVAVGSIIVVQPGEKVPLDGVVLEGVSDLDTSALTGESMPRRVEPEHGVVSGCINLSGLLKIRTTREFGESTVSKILELVENATSRKSRSENFITRFARWYTPAVCLCALLVAVLPPVVAMMMGTSPQWLQWLYRALSFLVASCPCALVISIPLSFFAGIGGASREGILIKGSNYLEALAKTDTVLLDKTGTLTQGNFAVDRVVSAQLPEKTLLEYAALAESASSHPISRSLKNAYGGELDRNRLAHVEEIRGFGIVATVDDRQVLVGNTRLLAKFGITAPECTDVGTVVYVAIQGEYAGYILIRDQIKENARNLVPALKAQGVKRCIMLTGDRPEVAQGVGSELGLDECFSGLLPEDKVHLVEKFAADSKKLVFAGDGINDAPVLGRADIGIAMGAMGSDAAIEAADVVLMDDDPMKIVKAIRISRKCMAIVNQNIVFAIGIKVLALILVALGLGGMWLAIFADVGVMVLAVLNAIRALFVKKL